MAYDISFYLNKTLLSKFLDFRCRIPHCFLELITFECTLSGKNVGVYSYETSSKKDESKDTNGENDLSHGNKILILIFLKINRFTKITECLMFNVLIFADSDTRVVISLSCFFGGSLIGIGVLVILKRFKTFKQMWVFNQFNSINKS